MKNYFFSEAKTWAPPIGRIPQPKDWDKCWFKWAEESFWNP